MSPLEVSLRLLAGLGLIFANAFFVATEFAMTRVRQYPAADFEAPGLHRAWEMTEELEIYLTSCQVGITASSIAVGIVAEPALAGLLEPVFQTSALAAVGAGSLLAFFIINLVHLTHGEQTPTYLGVERTKFVARYGAPPLYWFTKLIAPVIILGDRVAKWTLRLFGVEMTGAWLETEADVVESRADLRHRLGTLLEKGNLSAERRGEILNAFAVGDRPVEEVMTDREDIVFLSTEDPVATNLERIGSNPHTRLPLIGDGPADFRGIIYVPAVLDQIDALQSGRVELEAIAAPPMTIERSCPISGAVDRFQDAHQELALVVADEETDAVVGLITATDAFEAIMGDLEDPLDRDGLSDS